MKNSLNDVINEPKKIPSHLAFSHRQEKHKKINKNSSLGT